MIPVLLHVSATTTVGTNIACFTTLPKTFFAYCVLLVALRLLQYGAYADIPQSSSTGNGSLSPAAAAADTCKPTNSSSSSSTAMVSIPQGHGDLCDIPAAHVFPLSVMKFKGVPVSVPGDVPAVLRYRYGDTYMIPRCVL